MVLFTGALVVSDDGSICTCLPSTRAFPGQKLLGNGQHVKRMVLGCFVIKCVWGRHCV